MTEREPRRLHVSGQSRLSRELLTAGRAERAGASTKRLAHHSAAAALGTGAGQVGLKPDGSGQAGATAKGAGAGQAGAAKGAIGAWVKWVGIATIAGGLGVGGHQLSLRERGRPRVSEAEQTAASAASTNAATAAPTVDGSAGPAPPLADAGQGDEAAAAPSPPLAAGTTAPLAPAGAAMRLSPSAPNVAPRPPRGASFAAAPSSPKGAPLAASSRLPKGAPLAAGPPLPKDAPQAAATNALRGAPHDPAPAAAAPAASAQRPRGGAENDDALAHEIERLDRARAALARGDSARALRELDEHARGPAALAPEAEVVRIEALLRGGRRDEARALASRFLRRFPQSPHASRVRDVLR